MSLLARKIGRSLQRIDELDYEMRDRVRRLLEARRAGLRSLEARLSMLDLRLRFAGVRRRLEIADGAAAQAIHLRVARGRARFEPLAAQLHQLSPLRVLERGYAIVDDGQGRILKDAAAAAVDSEIGVRLARGRLRARVTDQRDI
jgi:exodeoxyribonuclease VII large subunit